MGSILIHLQVAATLEVSAERLALLHHWESRIRPTVVNANAVNEQGKIDGKLNKGEEFIYNHNILSVSRCVEHGF